MGKRFSKTTKFAHPGLDGKIESGEELTQAELDTIEYHARIPITTNGKRTTYGDFVAGELYTFRYNPKWKNILSYYDLMPTMLFLGYIPGRKLLLGYNFHYILPLQRKQNFVALARKERIKNPNRYVKSIQWRKIGSRYPSSWINVAASIRAYIPRKIKDPQLVPFDDWKSVAFKFPKRLRKLKTKNLFQALVKRMEYIKSTYKY